MAESTNKPQDPHTHGHDPNVNPAVSHERRDVNVFQISAFGIGLLLACIVTVFAMWALFDWLVAREDQKNVTNPAAAMIKERPQLPPEPRLQAHPKVDLQELKSDEDVILGSYGWVDPNKGIVRIPIDQAIDIVAQKGLPSKPSPAGTANDGYRTIPLDSNGGRGLEKISQ